MDDTCDELSNQTTKAQVINNPSMFEAYENSNRHVSTTDVDQTPPIISEPSNLIMDLSKTIDFKEFSPELSTANTTNILLMADPPRLDSIAGGEQDSFFGQNLNTESFCIDENNCNASLIDDIDQSTNEHIDRGSLFGVSIFTKPCFKPHKDRFTSWRARRKQTESSESRQIRLEKDAVRKSLERRLRDGNESITDRLRRLEEEEKKKVIQRKTRDAQEIEEDRQARLHIEAVRKKRCRDIHESNETEDQCTTRLEHEMQLKNRRRAIRNMNETDAERQGRLDLEAAQKKLCRSIVEFEETEDDRAARLEHVAKLQEQRREMRDINESENERQARLDLESTQKKLCRNIIEFKETKDHRAIRLEHTARLKEKHREIRKINESENGQQARLDLEAAQKKLCRNIVEFEETEDHRAIRLEHAAKLQEQRRGMRNINESENTKRNRLYHETQNKSKTRLLRNIRETEQQRHERLQLERELKRVQRSVAATSGVHEQDGNESIYDRESTFDTRKIHDSSESENEYLIKNESNIVVWPKIAPLEVKYKCLHDFKENMSNQNTEQITCLVCACLHYKNESIAINVGCIPNQHLLYANDDLPACVVRIDVPVDHETREVQWTMYCRLLNSKESTAIINRMLLCWKAIDFSNGYANICEKCHNQLIINTLPSFSLKNLMWLGDVPQELSCLTITEQKLIAIYRHSNCVIKLFSVTRDPSLAQTALKGNVITFPQSVSDIATSLPLPPGSLPDLIKVIFVGCSLPKREQLRSILTVRRDMVRQALIWLHANNVLYRDITIDHLLVNRLPVDDIPDSLWDTLSLLNQPSENDTVERSGYVNNDLVSEEILDNGPIALAASGLMDPQNVTTSSDDIVKHLLGRLDYVDDGTLNEDRIYLVPRGQNPVNEYFNTFFLPGLYPSLFPYGRGGVEIENRPRTVSYAMHLKYFLSYHDRRFEMNHSFIFVNFNILQRRTACAKARLLVSRPFFATEAVEINQITTAEMKTALHQLESNKQNVPANRRISLLLKQIKTVAGGVMGSNQSRAHCRVQLHAQIFTFGLPNIFITINPCDLHHPLAMKFAGLDLDIDNLLPDNMPNSQERAAVVAKHPVAIGRFFNKLIETVLKTLIGYSHHQHRSNPNGGILGKVDAYYGTVEESGRGALDIHMLLWLVNNMTPNELRASIQNEMFRNNLINYLEDIIKEDLSSFQTEQSESESLKIDKQNRTLASICEPIPIPNEGDFELKKRLAICTLVSECQIHRHSSTCYKYVSKTAMTEPSCRMRYPKEVYSATTIDTESGEIRMKRTHPMINNFNEWLLLACRSNMDIKFVWSGADTKALVYYITDYITKRSLSFHDTHILIHRAVDTFTKHEQNFEYVDALDRSRRLILRCFNTLASQQEISSVQVASYLMGWPDHYCSHTFVNVHLIGIERYLESELIKLRQQSTTRTTINETLNDRLSLDTINTCYDDENEEREDEIFEIEKDVDNQNFVLCNKRVDYQLRSPSLQHITLYSFLSEYRKAKMTSNDKVLLGIVNQSSISISRGRPPNDRWLFHIDHPQHSTHLIIRRSTNLIPVFVGPAIPRCDREDTTERYARAILTLFHPWTTVLDICQANQTWSAALKTFQPLFTDQSNKVISNIQLLHECKRDRDNDLFQLVNQAVTAPKEKQFSQPFIDAAVDDIDEILTLLDTNLNLKSSVDTQNMNDSISPQARSKKEYLDSTISNIIRLERFSQIRTNEDLTECINNKPVLFFSNNTFDQVYVRKATNMEIQKCRIWQHDLKIQKEQIRHTLLFGSLTEHQTDEQQTNEIKPIELINHGNIELLNQPNNDLFNPIILQTTPIKPVSVPDFVEKYSLNTEQARIFRMIQEHIEKTFSFHENIGSNVAKPEQLLMYIGGAGGCGKSQVIRAISDYMYHYGRLHRLRKLAPSSAAAVGIEGLTIQSMLHERRIKPTNRCDFKSPDIAIIEVEWRNIDYCLIDEVSMVGCYMLAQIHKMMTIAKHSSPSSPFGGISMIFLGDFVQYAPVLDRPLYSNLISPNETLASTIDYKPVRRRMCSERDIQCRVGRALWLQVNKVILLTQQMRNKDETFMALQARLRNGQCNDNDYEMLMNRVVKSGNGIESLREEPWNSSMILVFRNEVRTKINHLSVFDHANRLNQSPMVIVANDQIRSHSIDNADLREFLLSLPDNKTEGLPGYLPIVQNMPVLITHNVATELHISNGSIGHLVTVVYDDRERLDQNDRTTNHSFPSNTSYIRKPLYALVQLPQCKLKSPLADLEPMTIPIFPETKQIKIDLKQLLSSMQKNLFHDKTSITITRSQLPIIPAYAITTHKCQGKTLTHGIIDLVPPPYAKSDLAQTYVPVSRFTSLDKFGILRPFPRSVLNQKLPSDLITELNRLKVLDQQNRENTM